MIVRCNLMFVGHFSIHFDLLVMLPFDSCLNYFNHKNEHSLSSSTDRNFLVAFISHDFVKFMNLSEIEPRFFARKSFKLLWKSTVFIERLIELLACQLQHHLKHHPLHPIN